MPTITPFIELGDIVEVIDWGKLYFTYETASKRMYLKNWKYNRGPSIEEEKEKFHVIAKLYHDFTHEVIIGITNGLHDYIINTSGVKIFMRKDIKIQKSEPKIQKFDSKSLYQF